MDCKILSKQTALLLLVVVIVQLVYSPVESKVFGIFKSETGGHNLTLGQREDGDRLLYNDEIKRDAILFLFRTSVFQYPNVTSPSNNGENITYVEVINLEPQGKDGYAKLLQGGPGSNNVSIYLTSRWSEGFDFNISIYGL